MKLISDITVRAAQASPEHFGGLFLSATEPPKSRATSIQCSERLTQPPRLKTIDFAVHNRLIPLRHINHTGCLDGVGFTSSSEAD
jgi:hypothetical protein